MRAVDALRRQRVGAAIAAASTSSAFAGPDPLTENVPAVDTGPGTGLAVASLVIAAVALGVAVYAVLEARRARTAAAALGSRLRTHLDTHALMTSPRLESKPLAATAERRAETVSAEQRAFTLKPIQPALATSKPAPAATGRVEAGADVVDILMMTTGRLPPAARDPLNELARRLRHARIEDTPALLIEAIDRIDDVLDRDSALASVELRGAIHVLLQTIADRAGFVERVRCGERFEEYRDREDYFVHRTLVDPVRAGQVVRVERRGFVGPDGRTVRPATIDIAI